MKSFTRNNLISALVLGALGAPLSVYAASSAQVTIIATVTEKFSVEVDNATVSFNDGEKTGVNIRTTSNATKHGSGAVLSITSNVDASGKTMQLRHADTNITETYPVDVKVGAADANFAGANNKTTHNVDANSNGNTSITKLEFSSQPAAQTKPAGEYKGILTISVAPN